MDCVPLVNITVANFSAESTPVILPTPLSATSTISPMLKALSGVCCVKAETPLEPLDFFPSFRKDSSTFNSSSENSELTESPDFKRTVALF